LRKSGEHGSTARVQLGDIPELSSKLSINGHRLLLGIPAGHSQMVTSDQDIEVSWTGSRYITYALIWSRQVLSNTSSDPKASDGNTAMQFLPLQTHVDDNGTG
jgi:hypothetical protein